MPLRLVFLWAQVLRRSDGYARAQIRLSRRAAARSGLTSGRNGKGPLRYAGAAL